jgi:hypothetical protein
LHPTNFKNNNSPTSKVLSALGAEYYTLLNVADPSIDIGEGITRLHNASIAAMALEMVPTIVITTDRINKSKHVPNFVQCNYDEPPPVATKPSGRDKRRSATSNTECKIQTLGLEIISGERNRENGGIVTRWI